MKLLLSTISAIALSAAPALAQGNGNGNGNRGGGPAAQADRGGGNGNANRGNRGNGQAQDRGNRGGGQDRARGNGNRSDTRAGPPSGRGNGNARGADRRDVDLRGNGRGNGNGNAIRNANRNDTGNGTRNNRVDNDRGGPFQPIRYDDGFRADRGIDFRRDFGRVADGCPPGLARKYNGCRPPGLARQQDGDRDRYRSYDPDWWGLGGLFGNTSGRYRYDDGYLLRLGDGGRVSGYVPLLGGALSIGNAWPDEYRYAQLPSYYENYYGLGPASAYRYADNVVYRMDPETAAITSIAALLTGQDFTVGERVPSGYDVYNVPYSYRDRYYDTPDARYRYNDGYVYEIDPATMLIRSAIELLT